MQWKRCKKSKSLVADRNTWESRCQRYRVMQSHIPLAYGKYRGTVHLGYGDIYYALYLTSTWDIISKHQKKKPAEKACENHEQEITGGTSQGDQRRTRGSRGGKASKQQTNSRTTKRKCL